MSALLSSPTASETDPGARLERVKALREHRGFQWFLSGITDLRERAMKAALEGATIEEREQARIEYRAYRKAIDFLDSEERAAVAALKQKNTKEQYGDTH